MEEQWTTTDMVRAHKNLDELHRALNIAPVVTPVSAEDDLAEMRDQMGQPPPPAPAPPASLAETIDEVAEMRAALAAGPAEIEPKPN